MSLRDRLDALEQALQPEDAYRLLVLPDDGDESALRAQYRERTGYRGPLIVLSEDDARL